MLPRPGLPGFDYLRAGSYDEVVQLLQQHGPEARLMMGGTDLFVQMRHRAFEPEVVVDVKHLSGIGDIAYDPSSGLMVGAAATMNQVASHPDVRTHYPLLAEAAASVASYAIRNRATVGGNLCNASPCADTTAAILALNGQVVLHGPGGERVLPAERFFEGPGKTALQPAEFLTAIRIPTPPPASVGKYIKLGRSRAGDLSLVGVAVLGYPDKAAVSGYGFRIALGSVGPTVFRASEAEQVLTTNPPGEASFALAAEKAMEAAHPISDVRGTAAYQRAMVRNLTLRGLEQVWAQAAGRPE
jgi:carbon-monoxide dehydrogenase medium subunit